MKLLPLLVVFGCVGSSAPVPVTVLNPLVVKVQRDSLECWLEDPPEPPDKKVLNTENEDILSRVFVHMLDHNQVVSWTYLMWIWATNVKTCMDRVTE